MAAPATYPATETTTPTTDSTTPTSTAAPVAPVVAAESITTLPLFGAPLTVDVSTTPGGAIASVDVESANATLTATKLRPNRVAFVTDTDTGKVRVETRHGGENVSVKAGSLADIAGTGGWSGDVFGTNTTTTVAFTIAANADGGADSHGHHHQRRHGGHRRRQTGVGRSRQLRPGHDHVHIRHPDPAADDHGRGVHPW